MPGQASGVASKEVKVAETDSVLSLLERLPPRPGPSFDRLLDATERCLARYGIRRTSMTDIAREMHVARTTVYRQVGSVEEAMALVASRQLHRFLDDLLAVLSKPGGAGPGAFLEAIAGAVRFARSHPVSLRVLNDEPDIVGSLVTRDLSPYAAQVAEALAPTVAQAMKDGAIRKGDPQLAAQWLVRVVAALVVLPPEGDLEALLEYGLRPVLEIPGSSG
jgi:AcrR family transcriptional regulator